MKTTYPPLKSKCGRVGREKRRKKQEAAPGGGGKKRKSGHEEHEGEHEKHEEIKFFTEVFLPQRRRVGGMGKGIFTLNKT